MPQCEIKNPRLDRFKKYFFYEYYTLSLIANPFFPLVYVFISLSPKTVQKIAIYVKFTVVYFSDTRKGMKPIS